MSDLISRQAAVAEIEKPHDINLGTLPTGNRSFEDIWRCVAVAYEKGIAHAVKVLGALPSAQPDLDSAYTEGYTQAEAKYRKMWDEMPKIIRCKDCKHWKKTCGDESWSVGDCDVFDEKLVMCKGFCAWAERRTDE